MTTRTNGGPSIQPVVTPQGSYNSSLAQVSHGEIQSLTISTSCSLPAYLLSLLKLLDFSCIYIHCGHGEEFLNYPLQIPPSWIGKIASPGTLLFSGLQSASSAWNVCKMLWCRCKNAWITLREHGTMPSVSIPWKVVNIRIFHDFQKHISSRKTGS